MLRVYTVQCLSSASSEYYAWCLGKGCHKPLRGSPFKIGWAIGNTDSKSAMESVSVLWSGGTGREGQPHMVQAVESKRVSSVAEGHEGPVINPVCQEKIDLGGRVYENPFVSRPGCE